MHFQSAPHDEPKVVRCTRGSIYDAIIDIRPNSSTYGRWIATHLDEKNGRAIYVPPGFAHGFQTLADDTEVLYLMGRKYSPSHAAGIRYNDPSVGIAWPLKPTAISERDLAFPVLIRS
jgi:dTDP-4-dehydrorhamnose 3,5-epimerase